jgi:tryptophan synthase beta chain
MPPTKVLLDEREIPRRWYNIAADMPTAARPPLHPGTLRPIQPRDLEPLFPRALIEQEMSTDRWIDIPAPVLDVLSLWRPTPLVRARRLERALGTPARIYYKYEGVSPAGSHKTNTSVAQAYYSSREGVRRLVTETGAGQWGSALALACQFFGLEAKVYMVKCSDEQKPYRRLLMETWGATVTASPSCETVAGRTTLAELPDCAGSLGVAISEAVEDAISCDDTKYALGSVLNHVCLHQTIIGEEARIQMQLTGDDPDVVVACCGGGSNLAGLAFPFLRDKFAGRPVDVLGCEPVACPALTEGRFRYDFADSLGMTPLLPMYTLGHDFVPPPIHAGGLRYHGMAPLVSQLYADGLLRAEAYRQAECFEAAVLFARTEGIVPAPEASHAVRGAIDEALKAKEEGLEKTILFLLSGHGHFDMAAYEAYFAHRLVEYELPRPSA